MQYVVCYFKMDLRKQVLLPKALSRFFWICLDFGTQTIDFFSNLPYCIHFDSYFGNTKCSAGFGSFSASFSSDLAILSS